MFIRNLTEDTRKNSFRPFSTVAPNEWKWTKLIHGNTRTT